METYNITFSPIKTPQLFTDYRYPISSVSDDNTKKENQRHIVKNSKRVKRILYQIMIFK